MNKLFHQRWTRIVGLIVMCVAIVYALIYTDIVLRARSAYLQGEKYWQWYENPAQKDIALAKEFEKEKSKLDAKLAKKKISQDDHNSQLEILKFTHDQKLKESSIKYAYIWYQTVVELFSPPESKWVRLSREKMPKAKELWKQELRAKKIPFEDYMLE